MSAGLRYREAQAYEVTWQQVPPGVPQTCAVSAKHVSPSEEAPLPRGAWNQPGSKRAVPQILAAGRGNPTTYRITLSRLKVKRRREFRSTGPKASID